MKKYGILFNGQGSQYAMMGYDFYQQFDYVKEKLEEANAILGYDLKEIIYTNNDKLNDTLYTQPAIVFTSLMMYEIFKKETTIKPAMMAGFSLGEYSALAASGVFDFKTIMHLIKHRALFMEQAGAKTSGMMGAVLGMDKVALQALCDSISTKDAFVMIANYNCPGQLVVSGVQSKVLELQAILKDQGKRFIPLNVSGGFHTPLMEEASNKLAEVLKNQTNHPPLCDVVMNTTARVLEANQLIDLMIQQVRSPVLFEDSIRLMMDAGVNEFIEIGPGKVLSGFIRKIDRNLTVKTINTVEDMQCLLSESGE